MEKPSKSGRYYDVEFKRNAVELSLKSGRPVSAVARELDIPRKSLQNWLRQHRQRHGAVGAPGMPTSLEAAQSELKDLRRRFRQVEEDREILKKALAICSSYTDAKKSSV
jgi:transposase